VRVPRRLQELRLSLAKASDELEQGLDRQPTAAELSERLGISEAEVVEGQGAANAYTAGSLDAAVDGDSAEGPLSRRLGYEDRRFEGVDNLESLKPLVAELSERDRRILSLRFVADLTQSEIGAELGISQMHVSRLLNHALDRLRVGLLADS
jgi:RNA polymerase sigma-B factor